VTTCSQYVGPHRDLAPRPRRCAGHAEHVKQLTWERQVAPVGFNYYANGLSWDAVRGYLISTA